MSDLQYLDHIPTESGQVRVARLKERPSRVVVIIERVTDLMVIEGKKASMVALVSNELDYATSSDVRLEPYETGLLVPIIIETDTTAPLWDWQLGDPIGQVPSEFASLLQMFPDPTSFEARVGSPLLGYWDSRFFWKDRERKELMQLGSDFFYYIAGYEK